jgi:hypothetical protein
VVATQWRIGDRSTVRLVHDFYAGLARGATVADALRQAKLAALRRGAPPGEWAGFMVVGDPLVTVPLRSPPPRPWWAIGTAAVAALAAGWLLVRRRRASARSLPSAA